MLIGSRGIRSLIELRSVKLFADAERLDPCCRNEACGWVIVIFCHSDQIAVQKGRFLPTYAKNQDELPRR